MQNRVHPGLRNTATKRQGIAGNFATNGCILEESYFWLDGLHRPGPKACWSSSAILASMAGGKLLTREELERAAEAYALGGTFEAAARAIGRDPSAVRKALLRHGADRRTDAFALAISRVEGKVLGAVDQAARLAVALVQASEQRLAKGEPGGLAVLQSAMKALREMVEMQSKLALSVERRKLVRERRRREASLAVATRRVAAEHTPDDLEPEHAELTH